ncbi:RICIN domain-containing protein [Halorientalis pallida]|nr:RICIN domain-containing protein [Halorientalis pallida]
MELTDTRRTVLRALAVGGTGAGALSGQVSAATRTITVEGGGADIWDTEDAFHFYYTPLTGDFDISVHVESMDDTDPWAKAGLMVRQRLAADAENAMLRYTPGNETSVQWRSDDGDETDSTTSDDVGIGAMDASWLGLVREGDTITGYGSTDGSDWTRIARLTTDHLDMSEDTYVGLAVTSHDRGTLCSTTFDSLSGLEPTENRDIGDVAVPGSVTTSDGTDEGSGDTGAGETVTPGTYRLVNVNSGKVLDVAGVSQENGATLHQWEDLGNPNQHWEVEHLGDGEYRLTASHSGQVAAVANAATKDGADVRQWPWSDQDNKRWRIEPTGDGAYLLRAVHSGKVMDVTGARTGDGANVIQWPAKGSANQQWRFEPVEEDGENDDGGSVEPVSQFTPDAGFASTDWFDDDVTVHRVQEPTRGAVEAAFQASGSRLVVFETSGTIDLGGETLAITEDRCWVAGQTAPSPGITFVNGMVQVDANDCVVQHVRSRIGPGSDGNIQGNDSLNTADDTRNNVVDHVTASWGTDECLSVGYDTSGITYTNNLVYEGLYDPYGDGSDHNYGTLVGDGADDVTLAGNVWAKCRSRMPRLKSGTRSVVANNLVYYFDEGAIADDSAETSFVGNTYLGTVASGDYVLEGGSAYLEDNVVADPPLDSDASFTDSDVLDSRPLWPDGLDVLSSGDVEGHNLANAGARPADRTADDRRIVEEIEERAGNDRLDSPYEYWIPNPDAVGGYPELPENTRSLSVPDSGLRDWIDRWARAVEDPGASPP